MESQNKKIKPNRGISKKNKLIFFAIVLIDLLFVAIVFFLIAKPSLDFGHVAVLNPKGIIAQKERDLMVTAILLMLIVVVPVFFLLFFFAWKYRAGNTQAKYSPDLQNKGVAVVLWI